MDTANIKCMDDAVLTLALMYEKQNRLEALIMLQQVPQDVKLTLRATERNINAFTTSLRSMFSAKDTRRILAEACNLSI